MRILVVGAGATGGYFGGRLTENGWDVTFLVRPGRAKQLRAGGLAISSPHGDLRMFPELITAADLAEGPAADYDLILLAVKAFFLEEVVREFAPAVTSATLILPLLNGLRHIDLLARNFGGRHVLGGVCQVTTVLDPDGSIRQLNERHELVYGALDPQSAERIRELDAELQDVGFEIRRSDGVCQEMWEKWVYVAATGAITGLMRGVVGEIVAAPGGRDFALRVVEECASVAQAYGRAMPGSVLERIRATLTEAGSQVASSLYRDLCHGRPVEADHIIGDLIDRAVERGVEVPLLRLAYTHLSVYWRAPG